MVERHATGKGVEGGLGNSPGLQVFCSGGHTATAPSLLAMTVLLELIQVGELGPLFCLQLCHFFISLTRISPTVCFY